MDRTLSHFGQRKNVFVPRTTSVALRILAPQKGHTGIFPDMSMGHYLRPMNISPSSCSPLLSMRKTHGSVKSILLIPSCMRLQPGKAHYAPL